MFKDSQAFNSYSVDDIATAKTFYVDTLGLEVSEHEEGGMPLLSLEFTGGGRTMLYPKPDHQPAAFTVLNFQVSDIEAAVDALTERGVKFERYESIESDEKGIARGGGPLIAWFTDPAQNILSVLEA